MSEKIDTNLRLKILSFMDRLRREVKQNHAREYSDKMFDFDTLDMLTYMLANAYANQGDDQVLFCKMACREISNRLGKVPDRFKVQRKLKLLARYFILSVDSSQRVQTESGYWRNDTQTITFNPAFNVIFQPNQVRYTNDFIKKCVHLGTTRMDDEQGLTATYHYGHPERVEYIKDLLDFGEHFHETTEMKRQEAAEKREETKKWRDLNERFTQVAGKIWRAGRIKHGFGDSDPGWIAESKTISPAMRSQRRELTKTFETLGGTVAALSWYLYIVGCPAKDGKERLIFDPKIPHRQFRGSDFKPSSYAKHINAIIADKDFKNMSTHKWNEIRIELLRYFPEDILEVGPRDGSTYASKIGYQFGEISIPTLPQTTT
jgi:hypothetical protein